jgi:hypothetical protein
MLFEDRELQKLDTTYFHEAERNPDSPVLCSCAFDGGHEVSCDIVAANDLRRRLEHPPKSFLEDHALLALRLEPEWTVSMYVAYNDLTDETTAKLREFLSHHLQETQLR